MVRSLAALFLASVMLILATIPAASVPVAVKLSGDLPWYTDIEREPYFAISPDGRYVVFAADVRDDGLVDLFTTRLDGSSTPREITRTFQNRDVAQFLFTADSSRIVFFSGESYVGSKELFSVAIDGTDRVRIGSALAPGNHIDGFKITPDGTFVLYRIDGRLYKASILGGPSTMISGDMYAWINYAFTPDGEYVLFQGSATESGPSDLYRVPVAGGSLVRINEGDGLADVRWFQVSQDGLYAMYLVAQEGFYQVPVGGGTPLLLGRLSDLERISNNTDVQACPNSERLVYLTRSTPGPAMALYSLGSDGSGPVKLTDIESAQYSFTFNVSSDCTNVVYSTINSYLSSQPIYSVPILGGEKQLLGRRCGDWSSLTPDGRTLVFSGNIEPTQPCELYSTPAAGGTPTRISRALDEYTRWLPIWSRKWDGNNILASPDSLYAFYIADHDKDDMFELYQAAVDGSGVRKINGPLVEGGNVTMEATISPDGQTMVYVADADVDEQYELYAAPSGSSTTRMLFLPQIQH